MTEAMAAAFAAAAARSSATRAGAVSIRRVAIPAATSQAPAQLTGRVDVIWARHRLPVAVFEIDSTVKPRSFQKLKEAASPHKFWIYFGKDVWGFRTFLQKHDPEKEIVPIIVPRTFIPSFDDADGE